MFKAPFSFEGRIRRTEYGLSYLIYLVFSVPFNLYFNINNNEEPSGVVLIIFLLLLIPLVWFMLAQGAKRCHDRGNSGWFQIIPFYSLWMLFETATMVRMNTVPTRKVKEITIQLMK
jgi:uncharacterized membrane protein YhaH (DUF805 family)